jgi:hypothetical protein
MPSPPIPSILLTSPQDVYDWLGTEGAQLRLDDRRLATAQTITVTKDTLAGATSLPVMALTQPLLRGDTLEFDGGGIPAVVEVVLSAVAPVGSLALTVVPLSAAVFAEASAPDTGVNIALAQRLVKGCLYGDGQVKLYCSPRYDDLELARSWSVNRWATLIAARWVAKRLCRPCPQSLQADYEECLEELGMVKTGQLNVENAGTRTAGWPFITNTTVDLTYYVNKIRVEPTLSEGTPTQYPQYIDWTSAFLLDLF